LESGCKGKGETTTSTSLTAKKENSNCTRMEEVLKNINYNKGEAIMHPHLISEKQ